jgi:hypothetical protein
MPKVSEFYGIKIYLNIRGEHSPPHFHAVYGAHEALIQINPVGLYAGSLPGKALAMVIEWAVEHQRELMNGWESARAGQLPAPIPPLE